MNAESEMAGADGLGGESKETRGQKQLRELAAEIGYSDGADGEDEGGVDALIDYKNALEDRYLALVDGGLPGIDPEPLEGYEIMQQVVAVILNREEITAEEINRFLRGEIGAEGLYDDHIGRAVDACEKTIQADLAADAQRGTIYALAVVLEADSREEAFDRISDEVGPEPANAHFVGEPFEIDRADEYDSQGVASAIIRRHVEEMQSQRLTEEALDD